MCAQHRGDDIVQYFGHAVNFLVSYGLTYRMNSMLLPVRRNACQKSSRYCTVFVAVHRLGRTARLGPALTLTPSPSLQIAVPAPSARVRVQSEIGNLLPSRSKKLLRYSLPAKKHYTVNYLFPAFLKHFEKLEPFSRFSASHASAVFRLLLVLVLGAVRQAIKINQTTLPP